jgi:hypothetical protein
VQAHQRLHEMKSHLYFVLRAIRSPTSAPALPNPPLSRKF